MAQNEQRCLEENVMERWYLGSQNDNLFIINAKPRPSNDDVWPDSPHGPTMAISVEGLDTAKAQAIVDEHNKGISE